MNRYLLPLFMLATASCSTTPPPIETSNTSALTELERVYEVGKKKFIKKYGSNPFPASKHYHQASDIEHSHGNPHFNHNLEMTSMATRDLDFPKHVHNGKTHTHHVSALERVTSYQEISHTHRHFY